MATGTAGTVARALSFQALAYLAFTVNYNDAAVSTGFGVGIYLPQGSMIAFTNVYIKTAFNAASTNVLTVGTNSTSYNDIVNAADVDEATASKGTMVLRGMDLGKLSADKQPFYKYTQTGTAATAGVAYVAIYFNIDNDINSGT